MWQKWEKHLQLSLCKQKYPWPFYEDRNMSVEKKSQDGGDTYIFKDLAVRFWLTPKLSRRVRERQSYVQLTFQMDSMKMFSCTGLDVQFAKKSPWQWLLVNR